MEEPYGNPIIHGAGGKPRPVDTSTVTRAWAQAVLAQQRATIAALLKLGERLRAEETRAAPGSPKM